jgi:hypothetical protein
MSCAARIVIDMERRQRSHRAKTKRHHRATMKNPNPLEDGAAL